MKNTARKIRDLRKVLDLTQTEFGQKLGGVPQATVSKWERGLQEPGGDYTMRIAELAGVGPRAWLGISGNGEVEEERPQAAKPAAAHADNHLTRPTTSSVTEALLDKFPAFDPAWPDEIKAKWFDGYERLLKMGEHKSG